MVAIELGNGKTVMIKLEDWLSMTDAQFQDLIARNEGYEIDDPFHRSVDRIRDITDWKDMEIPEELTPRIPEELSEELVNKINRKIDGQDKPKT